MQRFVEQIMKAFQTNNTTLAVDDRQLKYLALLHNGEHAVFAPLTRCRLRTWVHYLIYRD